MIQRILMLVIVMFPISEIALALAIAAQWTPWARFPWTPFVSCIVALVFLVAGLAVRWTAIIMLGRFFAIDVAIRRGQVVVRVGFHRFMRHPSYTGLLMAFVGLGVSFHNWLSIIALLVPITAAVLNRVAKEEDALLASLGSDYAAYCARTKRFIPGVV